MMLDFITLQYQIFDIKQEEMQLTGYIHFPDEEKLMKAQMPYDEVHRPTNPNRYG